jgi:prepilin-type N-terminal cleavage/methylation domain-containing protein
MRSQSGFTLAEMMVVLLIGGVLTALAIPNLAQMREGYRLRSATREVYVMLQRARMAAVKENTNYRVYYTSPASLVVHDDLNSNNVQDAGEPLTTTNLQNDLKGVYFTAGPSAAVPLVFAPNGTTSSTTTVTVRNASGQYKQVNVSLAGRVQIVW